MHQLPTHEVMRRSLAITHPGEDPSEHMRKALVVMHRPDTHTHQFGNSLFVVMDAGHRRGYLSLYNADTPRNLIQTIKEARDWIYHKLGIDFLVFDYVNPAIETLAHLLITKHLVPQGALRTFNLDNGKTRAVLQLGPLRS